MAVTISLYNHTAQLFADQGVTLSTLKLMLLDSSASFDASDTDIGEVSGGTGDPYEVAGSGWTAGGETLSGVAATTVTTNDAKIDADDVSVTATGGAIGPADAAVIYDDTSGKPLAYIAFGASKTADEGTAFLVSWNASGIFTFSVT